MPALVRQGELGTGGPWIVLSPMGALSRAAWDQRSATWQMCNDQVGQHIEIPLVTNLGQPSWRKRPLGRPGRDSSPGALARRETVAHKTLHVQRIVIDDRQAP
ncbi:hypothetical protein HGRIS_003961 [Hohenbuehelia grisea]|uniref:Uncharacterized protein n=1 Tax=Hohenbuehelia grisea TaxID=104357 RepID=A0ABR3JI74_9AGAR